MYKKQIFKIDVLKKLLEDKNNCVSLLPCTRILALPPFYLNDLKLGVVCLLNSFLKKYDRALDGILIGYQNIVIKMDENSGIIPMGAAEIEINVSVEFYIFQPKIGNHLEAIVNKTSQNHIGCLVHKYFNATILKPEDVDYEDWICKNFKEGDKIIFKVKDLDFTGLLPYIEGVMDDEVISKQKYSKCDTFKHSPMKDCKEIANENIERDIFNSLFKSKVKPKNCNEEEDDVDGDLNDTLSRLIAKSLDEIDSNSEEKKKTKTKVKEKKNKKSEKVSENPIQSTAACEGNTYTNFAKSSNKDETSTDEHEHKKKKKKKKDKDKDRDKFEVLTQILPEDISTICYKEDNEDTIPKEEEKDAGKSNQKSKKEKKKIKNLTAIAESPKQSECLTTDLKEDSVFHSTQLESKVSDRFVMPFCSPIQADPVKKAEKKSKLPQLGLSKDVEDKIDKSDKKSSKKRKREDGEDHLVSKKPNLNNKSPTKVMEINGHVFSDEKSETQSLMEKIYQEQISRLKEKWREDESSEQDVRKIETKPKNKKNNKNLENGLSESTEEKVSKSLDEVQKKVGKIDTLFKEIQKKTSKKVADKSSKVLDYDIAEQKDKKNNGSMKNDLLEKVEETVSKISEQENEEVSKFDKLSEQKGKKVSKKVNKSAKVSDENKISEPKNNEVSKDMKNDLSGRAEEKVSLISKLLEEENKKVNEIDALSKQEDKKISKKGNDKSPKQSNEVVTNKIDKKSPEQKDKKSRNKKERLPEQKNEKNSPSNESSDKEEEKVALISKLLDEENKKVSKKVANKMPRESDEDVTKEIDKKSPEQKDKKSRKKKEKLSEQKNAKISQSNESSDKEGEKVALISKLLGEVNKEVHELSEQEDQKGTKKVVDKLSKQSDEVVSKEVDKSPEQKNKKSRKKKEKLSEQKNEKIKNESSDKEEEKVALISKLLGEVNKEVDEFSEQKDEKVSKKVVDNLSKQSSEVVSEEVDKSPEQKDKKTRKKKEKLPEQKNGKISQSDETELPEQKDEKVSKITEKLSKEKNVAAETVNKSPKKLVSNGSECKQKEEKLDEENKDKESEPSLVEKLLEAAKSSINFSISDSQNTKPSSEKNKRKKENVSLSEDKSKDLVKKEKSEKKRKRKEEGDEKPSKKFKSNNCDANHVSKTDGSGSETSSNQGKGKQMNGDVTTKPKSTVQTLLDDFFRKNSGKSDQVNEGTKAEKKSKEEMGQESLIEKLLRDARKSLKLKGDSPAKSKSDKKREKKDKNDLKRRKSEEAKKSLF